MIRFNSTATKSADNQNMTSDQQIDRARKLQIQASHDAQKASVTAESHKRLCDRSFAVGVYRVGGETYDVSYLSDVIDSYCKQRPLTFERNHGHEMLAVAIEYFSLSIEKLDARRRYTSNRREDHL